MNLVATTPNPTCHCGGGDDDYDDNAMMMTM
jgi:hypothetical protein